MIFIGHGGAGCKLATMFAEETKNKCITVDTRLADCLLPKSKTIEEAEENTPQFEKLLALKNEEIIFITAGSGNTSGSILRVLEQIKDNKIDVIYIRPDLDLLNKEQILKERVAYKVLQESTRAGLFNRIYLISNKTMAGLIADISLDNYFDKINEAAYKDKAPKLDNINSSKDQELYRLSITNPLYLNDLLNSVTNIMFSKLYKANKNILEVFKSDFSLFESYKEVKDQLNSHFGGQK